MGNKRLLKILLIVFLLIGCTIYYGHQSTIKVSDNQKSSLLSNEGKKLSTEQGIGVIQKLTKNDSEKIRYTSSMKVGLKEFYTYDGDINEYTIDSNKGNIVGIKNKVHKYSKKATITVDDALNDSQKYVHKYMPDIDTSTMKLTSKVLQDQGAMQRFYVTWQEFNGDTNTGNAISVILEGNGNLVSIVRNQSDPSSLLQEIKVSEDEAKKIAYSKLTEILKSRNSESIIEGQDHYTIKVDKKVYQENLIWDVNISGVKDKTIEGNTLLYEFYINVTTGEILNQNRSR